MQLRPRQQVFTDKCLAALSTEGNTLGVAPTGAGKTVSRAEAKAQGRARYFTGRPCSKGHVAIRYTSSGMCTICQKAANDADVAEGKAKARRARRYQENPEPFKSAQQRYYKSNKEQVKARERAKIKSEPDYRNAITRRYRQRHADRYRAYFRDYYRRNRHIFLAAAAKRNADLARATPLWADLKKIRAVYKRCLAVRKETGVMHHVDHIVPLRGKNVCGLHVHWNLQILTADENRQKSNYWSEDHAA